MKRRKALKKMLKVNTLDFEKKNFQCLRFEEEKGYLFSSVLSQKIMIKVTDMCGEVSVTLH